MINICIVHYNTPELTTCLVRSINKFTPNCKIYIFDNSDARPFTEKVSNVTVIDNTKGQIINFDKWLAKYPKRNSSPGKLNKWGSAKHCYSVEKCMDIIGESFILLDSDILIKKDISSFFDEKYIFVAQVDTQPHSKIKRVLPYICFINVKACKKNGVHYFDEYRMHGLRNNSKYPDGDFYDTGSAFYLNAGKLPRKEVKLDEFMVHYAGGSWVEKKEKLYGKHTMTPFEWLKHYECYWKEDITMNNETTGNKRGVVYTCITGGYDSLLKNIKVSKNFDYICYTDNPFIDGGKIWQIRPIPDKLSNLTDVKKQRYIKVNAHEFFPNYEISVWVDGVIDIRGDIDKFIATECNTNNVVFIPEHPSRKCIYKEGKACITLKKDTPANINAQMDRFKAEGFPENYGLVQSNIMVRKHNDASCIKLMKTWWEQIEKGSHRDQLSFNYAVWKNPDVKIKLLDSKTCNSEYFNWLKTSHVKKYNAAAPSKTVQLEKPQPVAVPEKKAEKLPATIMPLDRTTLIGGKIKLPVRYKRMTAAGNSAPKTKSLKRSLGISLF